MYIITSFDHSTYLEMMLDELQQNGVDKEHILAVPLTLFTEETKLLDTMRRSDGKSLLDAPLVWATIFTVVLSSYGLVLDWGPIVWGIIGALSGATVGLVLDYIIKRKKNRKNNKNGIKSGEVFIMIRCEDHEEKEVLKILKQFSAINFGTYRGS